MTSMPVIFLAHGAPMLLDDAAWVAELAAWAAALPRPKAILVVSAHWDASPTAIGATEPVPLVYDFYGFPARYYRLRYPAPGAPELAARVHGLLAARGIPVVREPERGLDHGVYVPLLCMVPAADIPVLQISMPGLEPAPLLELGRALAPLRDEGVLIIGSGFLTHNLRARGEATPSWAREFDAWAQDVISRFDLDAMADFAARAPAVHLALPTTEHYTPLLVAAGAASAGDHAVDFPITGYWNAFSGALTRRSVQFGTIAADVGRTV
jgi:4,5-DOPA dioxygenase extradiol